MELTGQAGTRPFGSQHRACPETPRTPRSLPSRLCQARVRAVLHAAYQVQWSVTVVGRRSVSRGASWRPFHFSHLPAGDYLLVFNAANWEDPYAPFRMTFYPNASSREGAQPIHLSDGQQVPS